MIAVPPDGHLPDRALRELCDQSYRLIFEKRPKKLRAEMIDPGRGSGRDNGAACRKT